MINKSKKLKFLQSREQWKTTNSNKEDNWSEMIQNLENEEGVCLSQFFFNKPKSQTPSYCYISEFFFNHSIRHAPNYWSISEFFQ